MKKKNQFFDVVMSGFMYGAGYSLGWYLMTRICDAIDEKRLEKAIKAEG